MRIAGLTLLLLLAACGRPESEPQATERQDANPAPAASPSPPPTPTATPVPQEPNVAITELEPLVGEYRVAGAGGQDIDLPHAITARIDSNGILFDSDCVQLSWAWFFEGSRLVTEQLFPRASCGRALLPEEEAIVAALNGATDISRTPANGVLIAGGGHSVLLFSQ